jgi:hypothetical protein
MVGEPLRLSGHEQLLLAQWTIKTAMVFDCGWAQGGLFFTEEERTALRNSLAPTGLSSPMPCHAHVWLARREGLNTMVSGANCLHGGVRWMDVIHPAPGYVVTLGAGHFTAQVMTVRPPFEVPGNPEVTYEMRPGPWHEATIRIWPAVRSSAEWPPRITLQDDGDGPTLEEFTDRWVIPEMSD